MARNVTPDDRDNARRLKQIWERKKDDLGLTQVKAAKLLEMTQGAVAQYLNQHISLNYEAVIAFARLLRVEPGEIDPSLGGLRPAQIDEPQAARIPIVRTLSGKQEPSKTEITTRCVRMIGQCYGIEVDSNEYTPFASKGTVLIANRSEYPIPGDKVIIELRDASMLIAELHESTNAIASITRLSTGIEEDIPMSDIKAMDPIVDMVLARAKRPQRLHSVG